MARAAVGLAVCLGLGLGYAAAGESVASTAGEGQPRTVSFDFENDGMAVSHWSIEIGADGKGRYVDLSHPEQSGSAAMRPLRVGAATQRRLDAGFAKVSAGNCETSAKHIAHTGTKRMAYKDAGDAWASCTFNYSEDKGLMDAAAAFESIAQTLHEGDRLEHSQRFDRLGLDAEMDELAEEVRRGDAIEVENIAPMLKSIAEDERVMERVRRKAARMLQDSGAGVSGAAAVSGDAAGEGAEPRER